MTLSEAAKILGISVTAAADEVRKAYRDLVKKWHPHLHPNDPKAEEMLRKVNEAYTLFKEYLENASNANSGRRPEPDHEDHRPESERHPGGGSASGRSGNQSGSRPGGNAGHTGSVQDDPIVKMYWQYYQNAKKDHEKFINGDLAKNRAELSKTEKELQKILNDSFGVNRDKERKCVDKLSSLLLKHELLIGRAEILADRVNRYLNLYNEAVAQFEKSKAQGGR